MVVRRLVYSLSSGQWDTLIVQSGKEELYTNRNNFISFGLPTTREAGGRHSKAKL